MRAQCGLIHMHGDCTGVAVDSRACVVPARSGVSAWYVAKSSSVPSFAFIDLGFDPCRDECDMPYDQKVVFDQFSTWMIIFQRK